MSNNVNPHAKLKESNIDYAAQIKELITENAKLHKLNIKYKIQNISSKNRISELEKQLQEASERAGIQIITRSEKSSTHD